MQKINKNLTFGIIASIKSIKDGWKNNHYEWFEKYTDACTTADIFIFGVTFKLIHTKSITIIASEYTTMKCSYKV